MVVDRTADLGLGQPKTDRVAGVTRALILGGGMIGSAMAADLAGDMDVTVADIAPDVLAAIAQRWKVATQVEDLGVPERVRGLAADFDIVLGALSSRMGLATLDAVIEARTPYVDISFMADDPLTRNAAAQAAGVPVVVDCGVGPGLTSMLAGHAAKTLAPCDRIEILVGGLPERRTWPYEYKAAFAPRDAIEEYTRPARMREHGREVVYDALSGCELVDLPGIGTLEAFHTDGLRTLLQTLDVPNLREKTMRYPGHAALMKVLRDTGFFGEAPIDLDGTKVVPLALTEALLFPQWQYDPDEADLTVLRVEAHGRPGGTPTTLRWDMLDRRDAASGLRSMSRTTAFPATLVARLVAAGRFTRPGVHPPEVLGAQPGILDEVLAGLRARGIEVTRTTR
jgi:saccharopine dehydrogenase-like NADP-dependent oxidoreductase